MSTIKLKQAYGDDNASDEDLITAVSFDQNGDYLAVGDKAGRVCIFSAGRTKNKCDYRFFTEFQSHESEFDYLKSVEIDERINTLQWFHRQANSLFILAANDKTIKLWKVGQKPYYTRPNNRVIPTSMEDIKIPLQSAGQVQRQVVATPKRVLTEGHQYHINSLSCNTDMATFLSADDLRINLWNPEVTRDCWNIVDVKPPNLEELTEVITSASFHPQHCNLFLYSTSRGNLRLGDMRDSALCDVHSKQFETEDDPTHRSFYSEIIASVSDAKFTPDGRYIISRDYFSLKLWDVNMESRPVAVIPVHDHLKVHLADLYENDCIFDSFKCDSSQDGMSFITGSYNNHLVVHNLHNNTTTTVEPEASSPRRPKRQRPDEKDRNNRNIGNNSNSASGAALNKPEVSTPSPVDFSQINFAKKTLHVSYHPQADIMAVAGLNKIYFYEATPASATSSSFSASAQDENKPTSLANASSPASVALPNKR